MEEMGFDSDSKKRTRVSVGGKARGSQFEWTRQQRQGRANSGRRGNTVLAAGGLGSSLRGLIR